MFVTGIGTASPSQRYSKAQCWHAFKKSEWFNRLSPAAHLVAETVLSGNNGIEWRHLAVPELDDVFNIDADELHHRFAEHAPKLAIQASSKALNDAGLDASDIKCVVVSTCTGYLCPGLSGYIIEGLQLQRNTQAFDLIGQGCAAALPNLCLANALLASGQCDHVLSICVEICSAAMYLDNDPGVLISACLFGDGAGAVVLSRHPKQGYRRIEWMRGESLIDPSSRNALLFEWRGGLLRNVLTRRVPRLAAEHAYEVMKRVLHDANIQQAHIRNWIMHAGGRDVLIALQQRFEVESNEFRYSAAMLREYGNLSSAFLYYVLQAALTDDAEGGWWWLSSFGAGFSCHGALLKVE